MGKDFKFEWISSNIHVAYHWLEEKLLLGSLSIAQPEQIETSLDILMSGKCLTCLQAY